MKKSFLILSVAFAIFAISCSEDPKPADPDDPGTEQPEDPGTEQPEDPADEEVTDLNASNPETANCYIISKGGRYCFNADIALMRLLWVMAMMALWSHLIQKLQL